MRRGRQDAGPLVIEGVTVGVNLGWDWAAEHEWGIKGIKRSFGIAEMPTRKVLGRWARNVTSWPTTREGDCLRLMEHDGYLYLVFQNWWRFPGECKLDHEIAPFPFGDQTALAGAWSEADFAARAKIEDDKVLLNDLHQAFKDANVVIWPGGGGAFANAGLCLGIADRMPPEVYEAWEEADTDHLDLLDHARPEKFRKKLNSAGCKFYALRPSWANAEKTEIKWYLNPERQDKHNSGWFTTEELLAWTKGEGPVFKEEKGADR